MNIVLIGYRGSGKTIVGQELARLLRWPLVDTDAMIEKRAGRTIREIFAEQGEPAFRQLEVDVIAEVSQLDRRVISAGGGAVLRDENIQALKANGRLVWLTAPAEILWSRIQRDAGTRANRPNLTVAGGLEEVRQLLTRRTPIYQAAADLMIDSSILNAPQLAGKIHAYFKPEL